MKKLTLNKAWKECLRMWKWIDGQIAENSMLNVVVLKQEWMEQHGYRNKIINDCFFCDWHVENTTEKNNDPNICSNCLGTLVSKQFTCSNKSYDYASKPRKFYQKLLQLDKKRKTK